MKETLLNTKLFIPPGPPGLVKRSRLKERLDAGRRGRFILISAPAGFGKTSLLSDWLTEFRGGKAWISLDPGDNDPFRFLRYLVYSLQSAEKRAAESAARLLEASQADRPAVNYILTLLLNALAQSERSVMLVLDDYHLIENPRIHEAVAFLIENAPAQLVTVLLTRHDPPFPLARWRARGQMAEIRGEDLRFSIEEAGHFFSLPGAPTLTPGEIATLEEKTEGWAAGLQMAWLSMQGRPDLSGFVRTFSGSHRYIMDYLVEEVLSRQPESVQTFLLQTSILDRLHGELCEAVTGQPEGARILENLERANMFILPLDEQRQWYRFHHLFADLLRARLIKASPGLVPTLHRRAAGWLAAHHMIPEAISQALAAGDNAMAAMLIEESALTLLLRGELSTALNWTEQLPDSVIAARPRLCVNLAWLLFYNGRIQEAEPWLQKAEDNIDRQTETEETRDIKGNIAAERAILADIQGNSGRALEMAEESHRYLSGSNPLIRSVLPFSLARAYRMRGEMPSAYRQLEEVARLARASGSLMTLSTAVFEQAAICKIEGKLKQAERLYRELLRLAEKQNLRDLGNLVKIDAGLSDVLREWNRLAEARQGLSAALERMQTWQNPTDLVIVNLALARTLRAAGDLTGAAAALERAESAQREAPVFEPLGTQTETERVLLRLAAGETAAAGRWADDHRVDPERPVILREIEILTLARVYLEQSGADRALELLSAIEDGAEKGARYGRVIEIMILKALAHKARGEEGPALRALGRALLLAEPEDYRRVFIEGGSAVGELLSAFKNHPVMGVLPVGKAYLNELLADFYPLPDGPAGRSGLVEDLSEREREVLRLLAQGLTNRQIADALFISTGTVKAHTAGIYRKLEAANRTQAIALAREKGLL